VAGTYLWIVLSRYTHWEWMARVAEMIHYLPLFAIGVVSHAWYRRQVRVWTLAGLVPVFLGAYIWNLHYMKQGALIPEVRYPLQVTYATVVFLTVLAFDSRLRIGRIGGWIGDLSYSLYLVHMNLGSVVLGGLLGRAGITIAVMAAVASALLAAWLLHVVVEKPSQKLARRLLAERPPELPAVVPDASAA
jgi:peptidoglycan/LPS O-acetylase OafA/YrhL